MSLELPELMNEISGLGGYYERCCRAAVKAGAEWCLKHPTTFDPAAVEAAINNTEIARDDGLKVKLGDELTGAQMGVAMHHIRYIATNGWKRYCDEITAPIAHYGEDQSMESSDTEHPHDSAA